MPACYIGVGNAPKKVKSIYIGIGGKATKVKKGYIGINGQAKLFFSGEGVEYINTISASNLSSVDGIAGTNSRLFVSDENSTKLWSIDKNFTVNTTFTIPNSVNYRKGVSTDNYAFFFGGYGSYNVYAYNSSGTRTNCSTLQYSEAVNGTKFNNYAVAGTIIDGNSENAAQAKQMYFYNTSTSSLTQSKYTLSQYRDLAVLQGTGDYCYIVGGCNTNGGSTGRSDFEMFSNTLSRSGPYNCLITCMGASAALSNNEAIFLGGENYYGYNNKYGLEGHQKLFSIKNGTYDNYSYYLSSYKTQTPIAFENFGFGYGNYALFLGGAFTYYRSASDDYDTTFSDTAYVIKANGTYDDVMSTEVQRNFSNVGVSYTQTLTGKVGSFDNIAVYGGEGVTTLRFYQINT